MRFRIVGLLVAAVSGCGSSTITATQALVVISAQGAVLDASSVRVRVLGGPAGKLMERRVVDIPVKDGWPIELVIQPKDGDITHSWKVEAWGLRGGSELGAGTIAGGFESHQLVEHRLVLKSGMALGALPKLTTNADGGASHTDGGASHTSTEGGVRSGGPDGAGVNPTDAGSRDSGATSTRTDSGCPSPPNCDDKDPCTIDELTRGATNCNTACMHTPITVLQDGDMCCPKDADANTDKDCKPTCGNGVREPGEVCDGTAGCSSDCQSSSLTPDQMRCLQEYASDACEMCSCMNCAGPNQYIACRDTDKAAGNQKCNAVLACSRKNNCSGSPCYCANDSLNCALGNPTGPCKAEIEAAAGAASGDWLTVNMRGTTAGNPPNPLFLAYTADMCRVSDCKTECR